MACAVASCCFELARDLLVACRSLSADALDSAALALPAFLLQSPLCQLQTGPLRIASASGNCGCCWILRRGGRSAGLRPSLSGLRGHPECWCCASCRLPPREPRKPDRQRHPPAATTPGSQFGLVVAGEGSCIENCAVSLQKVSLAFGADLGKGRRVACHFPRTNADRTTSVSIVSTSSISLAAKSAASL